jgi:hypothetical protein
MIPKLSPAALSLNLGAGQPGFGQAPGTEEENEEVARRRKLLGSANVWSGSPLSAAALSLGLGNPPGAS